jgi:hypothetical protein
MRPQLRYIHVLLPTPPPHRPARGCTASHPAWQSALLGSPCSPAPAPNLPHHPTSRSCPQSHRSPDRHLRWRTLEPFHRAPFRSEQACPDVPRSAGRKVRAQAYTDCSRARDVTNAPPDRVGNAEVRPIALSDLCLRQRCLAPARHGGSAVRVLIETGAMISGGAVSGGGARQQLRLRAAADFSRQLVAAVERAFLDRGRWTVLRYRKGLRYEARPAGRLCNYKSRANTAQVT